MDKSNSKTMAIRGGHRVNLAKKRSIHKISHVHSRLQDLQRRIGQHHAHENKSQNKTLGNFLAGKVLIINQVLLASIFQSVACAAYSPEALKIIKTLIRDYVWSGKTNIKLGQKLNGTQLSSKEHKEASKTSTPKLKQWPYLTRYQLQDLTVKPNLGRCFSNTVSATCPKEMDHNQNVRITCSSHILE